MSDGAHPITDEFMRSMLAASRTYSLVVLTPGPNYDGPDAQAVIWEHGRRNFELRAAGTLAIVGPVRDESDLAGIGIFTTDLAETAALMAQDPAITAGVLVASVHPITGFPGDGLPRANRVADGSADRLADGDPASDKAAGGDPAGDDPASDDPASDNPANDDPANDDPANDDPMADKPASDEPANDDSAEDRSPGDHRAGDRVPPDDPSSGGAPAEGKPAAGTPA